MDWSRVGIGVGIVAMPIVIAIGCGTLAFRTNHSEREQFKAEHHCKPAGQRVEYRQIWICDGGAMTLL